MTLHDLADKGGVVFWILAAYSVIAVGIVIERLIRFTLMGNAALPDRATDFSSAAGRLSGPEGRVVAAMTEARTAGVADLVRVATRTGSAELRRMEKGFRTLAFLGNTAPLLGLFGTVTGMIRAFMVIEQAGGKVDAQALAGGIWEAMVTTGVGLAVALPILLALHTLEGIADGRAAVVQEWASLVLERFGGVGPTLEEDAIIHARELSDEV